MDCNDALTNLERLYHDNLYSAIPPIIQKIFPNDFYTKTDNKVSLRFKSIHSNHYCPLSFLVKTGHFIDGYTKRNMQNATKNSWFPIKTCILDFQNWLQPDPKPPLLTVDNKNCGFCGKKQVWYDDTLWILNSNWGDLAGRIDLDRLHEQYVDRWGEVEE